MIIAILGFSGSGKTLLTNILVKKCNCLCSVHTTTRSPRMDDKELLCKIVTELEKVTPLPKPKKRREKQYEFREN